MEEANKPTTELPISLESGRQITAIRPAGQIPESVEGEASTGWIEVPAGAELCEVVIDGDKPTNRVLRMSLFVDENIPEQIGQKEQSCLNS